MAVEDTSCECGTCHGAFADVEAFDAHRRQRGGCTRPAPAPSRHEQLALPWTIPKPRRTKERSR